MKDQFHSLFYNDSNTWPANRWFGIPTEQNPNDAWIIQEIISQVKPDFIIETGTLLGGSAVLWATILEHVNPEGRVITIDINDRANKAKTLPIAQRKVDFVIGSSTDREIINSVAETVLGKKTMVILDSLHTGRHVYRELQLYSKLVSLGSYLVVHDTNINGHPVFKDFGPGPIEAVKQFMEETDEFEIDMSRERLLFTMHPNGYLKRIK